MPASDATAYIDKADQALDAAHDEPMSIQEYVEQVLDEPGLAVHAAQYILDAIEAAGTRTVVEAGEEFDRYRFFDDPHNGGEHAVIGNTQILNRFVADIRAIAHGHAKDEKMLWVVGPTGSGKSELKRCLINGLREYSKTPEGRRYTLEWNIEQAGSTGQPTTVGGMSYGDGSTDGLSGLDTDSWYESPVQVHPLAVFPTDVQEDICHEIDESLPDDITLDVEMDLDPFSQEVHDYLADEYSDSSTDALFTSITDEQHCRVRNYVLDEGQGIGVLNADDGGKPKQRLVGTWMASLLKELDTQGQKDARAFSYDGVLSQGNGGMTIVEETGQHLDLLTKLFNVPDESHIKLDTGIGMDLDTVILLISNPDMQSKLSVSSDLPTDAMRALRRRLSRHDLTYLLSMTKEAELLRREILEEYDLWPGSDMDERRRLAQEGVTTTVGTDDGAVTRELAPHAIETAAMYDIITRIDPSGGTGQQYTAVHKALLYEFGTASFGGSTYDIEQLDDVSSQSMVAVHVNPRTGVPPTFTRDVVYDLLQTGLDREHQEYDVGSVIMPDDILNVLDEHVEGEPMFGETDEISYRQCIGHAREYAFEQQEDDVLDAVLSTKRVGEDGITEYLKHVYAWVTGEDIDDEDGNTIDPDPLTMKVFEVERFGLFDESEYTAESGSSQEVVPSNTVIEWREEDIASALESANYRGDGGDSFWDVPELRSRLYQDDWSLVERLYENLEYHQWDDPPEDSVTAEVKEQTIDYMASEYGYTEASAELTTRTVFDRLRTMDVI